MLSQNTVILLFASASVPRPGSVPLPPIREPCHGGGPKFR